MPTQDPLHERFTQLRQALQRIPFTQTLGLGVTTLSAQAVEVNFKMKQELIGNFFQGILHGGVIASVFDMAGGMVIMAAIMARHSDKDPDELTKLLATCSTVDLQVSYLRPGKGEHFRVQANLVKLGSHISFARMELKNQDDSLIASGSGTYTINPTKD